MVTSGIRRGDGPPVALIPGLGCDQRLWNPVAHRLAERFTVIQPETWGRGSLEDAARAVVDALDRLDIPAAAVCGLSMGGYIVFELLRVAPERLRALVFADTTAFEDAPDRVDKRRQVLELIRQDKFDAVLEAYVDSVVARGRDGHGAAREALLDMGRSTGPGVFASDVEAILARRAYDQELTSIHLPTLFLVGAEDALTPPEVARRMAGFVPGARVVTVAGAGHMVALEAPDEVARELADFLSDALAPR